MKDKPYEFKVAGVTVALKRDTSENWRFNNPVLGQNEAGYDLTTHRIKVGDGETPWLELPWFAEVIDGAPTSEDYIKVIAWLWHERHNITTDRRGGVHMKDMPPLVRFTFDYAIKKDGK